MRYRAITAVGSVNSGEIRDFVRSVRDIIAEQNGYRHWEVFIEADAGLHYSERHDYDARDPFFGQDYKPPAAPEFFA